MKKRMCLFLAALLLCVFSATMAEDVKDQADAFSGDWISENNREIELSIWNEEGKYDLTAVWYDGKEKLYSITFESCAYAAEKNELLCEGGVLLIEKDGAEEEEEQEIASGFGAVLTMDEKGMLHWSGSGDALADQAFIPWNEEEDGRFTGEWEYGDDDAWIRVELHNGVYTVTVDLDRSDDEATRWEYTCALDESGALKGSGTKTELHYNDDSESAESQQGSVEGQATFTLEGESLIWNDATENAGEGMRFERVAEEEDTEDDDEDENIIVHAVMVEE